MPIQFLLAAKVAKRAWPRLNRGGRVLSPLQSGSRLKLGVCLADLAAGVEEAFSTSPRPGKIIKKSSVWLASGETVNYAVADAAATPSFSTSFL